MDLNPPRRSPLRALVFLFFYMVLPAAAETEADAGGPSDKPWGITAFPIAAYSGETGLMGGAYLMFFDYPGGISGQGSMNSVSAYGYYTQKQQAAIGIMTDRYFRDERLLLSGNFFFSRFPGKFFGLGPESESGDEEDYTPITTALSASLLARVSGNLYVGPAWAFSFLSIDETESEGMLAGGLLPGSDGGVLSGLGARAVYDSRDTPTFPRSGYLVEARSLFHGPALGSDFTYAGYLLDARGYFGVGAAAVVAVQTVLTAVGNEAPFQIKPSLGGTSLLRGFVAGRFVDDVSTVLQGELRFPIRGRLGGVAFAGIGNVAPSFDRYAFDSFRAAGGAGIRYALQEDPRLNLRADFAFSPEGFDLTVSILEAF